MHNELTPRSPLDPYSAFRSPELIINQATRNELVEVVRNYARSRLDWYQAKMDPRRDIDKECGYPKTQEIGRKLCKDMYDRLGIATRVVDILPNECFSVPPEVYEDEDSDAKTPFETDWDAIGTGLLGGSLYKQEEGNPIWEIVKRAVRLSRIGSFGIILIGIDDGKGLHEPAAGFMDGVSYQEDPATKEKRESRTSYTLNRGLKRSFVFNAVEADKALPDASTGLSGGENGDSEGDTEPEPTKGLRKLLYLRPFDETCVTVTYFDENPASPRYGQPMEYLITMGDDSAEQSSRGVRSVRAHWSRVIHISDNNNGDEVFGVSALRPSWNRYLDLSKIYGASAEGYWQMGFPFLSFDNPNRGGMKQQEISFDKEEMREQIYKVMNHMQRYLAVDGFESKLLSPTLGDPNNLINAHLDAISIQTGIPKRILVGSERGELASSQDSLHWKERKTDYKINFLSPRVVIPLVDRLIQLRCVSTPKQFCVYWPEAETLGPLDRIQVAKGTIEIVVAWISSGADTLFSPMDLLTRILDFSEEEAIQIVESAMEHISKANPRAEDEIVPGRNPLPPAGEDPAGNPLPDPNAPPAGKTKGAVTTPKGAKK